MKNIFVNIGDAGWDFMYKWADHETLREWKYKVLEIVQAAPIRNTTITHHINKTGWPDICILWMLKQKGYELLAIQEITEVTLTWEIVPIENILKPNLSVTFDNSFKWRGDDDGSKIQDMSVLR